MAKSSHVEINGWMGVFSSSWMKLLQHGGLSYKRARALTGKLCEVISQCRSEVAKARHARASADRVQARAERVALVDAELRRLWEVYPARVGSLEGWLSEPFRRRSRSRRWRRHGASAVASAGRDKRGGQRMCQLLGLRGGCSGRGRRGNAGAARRAAALQRAARRHLAVRHVR